MKTTDLMIGDLVLAEGKPTRVTDIDEFEGINREWIGGVVCEDAGCTSWEHIEPIPLTKDILEKNIDSEYKHYKNGHAIYGIGKYPKIVEITWFIKEGAEWTINGDEYGIVELHYVHELQHVLKLCGIEKEIVL